MLPSPTAINVSFSEGVTRAEMIIRFSSEEMRGFLMGAKIA